MSMSSKIVQMLRRETAHGVSCTPADLRAQHIARRLRAVPSGQALPRELAREIHVEFSADLVDPGRHDLVPRLFHELEGEPAVDLLADCVDEATEVFDNDGSVLLAFAIPYVIRLTCQTERRWMVSFMDRNGRIPVGNAIAKVTGAQEVVLDPHVYDGSLLWGLRPARLKHHFLSMLEHVAQPDRQPAPLVEPSKLMATSTADWELVFQVGCTRHREGESLSMRDKWPAWLRSQLYLAELAFPLDPLRLLSNRIHAELKPVGVFPWNRALRVGHEALRRFRFSHQAWIADTSRHLVRSPAGDT